MPVPAAKPDQPGTMRLNRFIASSGVSSRRRADELIILHKVKVNGKLVTELGVQVKPYEDQVTVEGKVISLNERFIYLLLNKPKDLITTVKDERDRKTVMSLINTIERVYPVGRLDRQTTGVLLFTNDGELTARLTHPKYQVPRVYHVVLDKPLKRDDAMKIAKGGVDIGDGDITAPVELELSTRDGKDVIITLREGKYHEVRRLFDVLGYTVEKLDRLMFAGVSHKGMKRGETRSLLQKEVRALKRSVGLE